MPQTFSKVEPFENSCFLVGIHSFYYDISHCHQNLYVSPPNGMLSGVIPHVDIYR
jgi:hypothetical protein